MANLRDFFTFSHFQIFFGAKTHESIIFEHYLLIENIMKKKLTKIVKIWKFNLKYFHQCLINQLSNRNLCYIFWKDFFITNNFQKSQKTLKPFFIVSTAQNTSLFFCTCLKVWGCCYKESWQKIWHCEQWLRDKV